MKKGRRRAAGPSEEDRTDFFFRAAYLHKQSFWGTSPA